MREIAKSMLGFSWAVSLFGVQQISKALSPSASEPEAATVAEFEEVSRAVQSHLSGDTAARFQAGDQWTRNLVDVVFDAATWQSFDARRIAESLDPRPVIEVDPRKWAETGVTMFQQSVNAVRQAVTPAAS